LSATTDSIPVLISVTSAPPAVVLQDPGTVGGEFHFSFATRAGFTYFVQSTDSFNPIRWQPVTNFTGSGTMVVVTNTVTSAERFYRVRGALGARGSKSGSPHCFPNAQYWDRLQVDVAGPQVRLPELR